MTARSFELIIELHPGRVFYSLNYVPPIKGLGGSIGTIGAGGCLHSMSYEELRSLGDGRHLVEVDETIRKTHGYVAEPCSDDERNVDGVRFELFMLRTGACTRDTAMCSVVLAFNERTAQPLLSLLDGPSHEWLVAYAKNIPLSEAERRVADFRIFSSSGGEAQVPDENLAAIRRHFGL